MKPIKIYFIDLYSGLGGVTTSVCNTENMEVIWAINHDPAAIRTHSANHKDVKHSIEDIRTVDISEMAQLVKDLRKADPTCKIILHGSVECQSFSRARSGAKNPDSRTLAEHMFRYLDAIDPDMMTLENVVEFRNWGDLDENNNPDPAMKGRLYEAWVEKLTTEYFGKEYYAEDLVSADYGGCTIRKRLFMQFSKDPAMIGHPIQTHSKDGSIGLPWRAVSEVLDFENIGKSIFTRKKDFVPNTHKNLINGLNKHGHETGINFGYTYYGNSGLPSVESPAPTMTTKDRMSLVNVTPLFLTQQFGNAVIKSLKQPFGTLTVVPKGDIVSVKHISFLTNPAYGGSNNSVEKPCPTVVASQHKAPLGMANVKKHELDTVLRKLEGPVTQHIEYTDGIVFYNLFESDDEYMTQIKEYMFANQLLDICVRPLTVYEMKLIQGFPEDYILTGNQTENKKHIGNSVEVNVGTALYMSIDNSIQNAYRLKA